MAQMSATAPAMHLGARPQHPAVSVDDESSLDGHAAHLRAPCVAAAVEAIKFIPNWILQVVVLMGFLGVLDGPSRYDRGCDRVREALLHHRLGIVRQQTVP